jgi:hypothetical protein
MKVFVVTNVTIIMQATENVGLTGIVSGLYSEGTQFEFLPAYL